MTRGFSFLLPVIAVESVPSTEDSWTMLVILGTETPGSSLTVTPSDRMDDGCGESSTLPAELSLVVVLLLLLLFMFIVVSLKKSEES